MASPIIRSTALQPGTLYELGGAVLRVQETENGHVELITIPGRSGSLVGLIGYDIDGKGNLHPRIAEPVEMGAVSPVSTVTRPNATVADLRSVKESELLPLIAWEEVNSRQIDDTGRTNRMPF